MPKLLDRLVSELESKGTKDAYALATSILQKNGYLDKHWELTQKWKIKQSLPEWTKGIGDKKTVSQAIRSWLWKK